MRRTSAGRGRLPTRWSRRCLRPSRRNISPRWQPMRSCCRCLTLSRLFHLQTLTCLHDAAGRRRYQLNLDSSVILSSHLTWLFFFTQELAVLQEELDILVTRREDYEAVSCTRPARQHASSFGPIRVSVSRQRGSSETYK